MLSSIDIQNLKQLLNFHEQIVEYLYLLIVPWQNLFKLSFFSKKPCVRLQAIHCEIFYSTLTKQLENCMFKITTGDI